MGPRLRRGIKDALINGVNPVHFVHRHHDRPAVSRDDQHARHDSRTACHATGVFEPEQIHQRQARHQRTAHIRHAEQGPGTLVRQRMNRLQRRHLHQTARGQSEPFFAEAEHQQRPCFDLTLDRDGHVPAIFLLQRITIQQTRRRRRIHRAVAAMNMLAQ
ncbi:hypothetical protein D3C84_650940 [compost metagenome]